jgi:hypothetical protein
MRVILEIIDSLGQPVQLVALIALLYWIGGAMVASRDNLRAWGYRLAATSLVGYGAYGLWIFEPVSADEFLGIAIRALFAAGWTAGFSWIVLATVMMVYTNTILPIRYHMRVRANRRFEEQRERILFDLRMARKALEAPATTTVAEQPEPPKRETVIDQARREKSEYEQRLETLKELKDVSGLDDELLQEFEANELERYIRRMTDVLGYRQ